MDWVNEYKDTVYQDGGRGPVAFDCWGLVRDVLQKQFNVPTLASFGQVDPDDKPGMTAGYRVVRSLFKPSAAKPGAVACGYKGPCLVHVGVVIADRGLLRVLHISRDKGVSVDSLRDFERLFLKTGFYHYADH